MNSKTTMHFIVSDICSYGIHTKPMPRITVGIPMVRIYGRYLPFMLRVLSIIFARSAVSGKPERILSIYMT